MTCTTCNQPATNLLSAVVNGTFYPDICRSCLNSLQTDSSYSSGHQSFDRRRQYEDNAQDTVQPYTASGPNLEFLRLYPKQSEKIYSKDVIEKMKSKL